MHDFVDIADDHSLLSQHLFLDREPVTYLQRKRAKKILRRMYDGREPQQTRERAIRDSPQLSSDIIYNDNSSYIVGIIVLALQPARDRALAARSKYTRRHKRNLGVDIFKAPSSHAGNPDLYIIENAMHLAIGRLKGKKKTRTMANERPETGVTLN